MKSIGKPENDLPIPRVAKPFPDNRFQEFGVIHQLAVVFTLALILSFFRSNSFSQLDFLFPELAVFFKILMTDYSKEHGE